MNRSLANIQSSVVDKQKLDELIRAAIFFGDVSVLRATYFVPKLEASDSALIIRKISELEEMGIVKYWAHEYEVEDSGIVRGSGNKGITSRSAHLVMPQRALNESLLEMDDHVQNAREHAYLKGSKNELRQGTAEFVRFRESLIALVIASQLGQDGLITSGLGKSTLKAGISSKPRGEFKNSVLQEVFGSLKIGPLWHLTPDQILEARKFSTAFKAVLDDAVLAAADGVDTQVTPRKAAEELVERYQDVFRQRKLSADLTNLRDDVLWDLASTIVPPTLILKYGLKAFKWRKDATNLKPFLLLSSIQSNTASND